MSNPFRKSLAASTSSNLPRKKTRSEIDKLIALLGLRERKIQLRIAIVSLATTILGFGIALYQAIPTDTCDQAHEEQIIDGLRSFQADKQHIFIKRYFTGNDPKYTYRTRSFEGNIPPEQLPQFLETYRRDSYYQFIHELVEENKVFPLPIVQDGLTHLLNEEQRLGKGVFTHSNLDKIFLITFDSVAYECHTQTYSYTIGLAVPRYMNTYFQDLSDITSRNIEKILPSIHGSKHFVNQTINIENLTLDLRNKTDFENEFCMELRENSDYYSIFRGLENKIHPSCQLEFELGAFDLHPAGIAILEQIGDRYAREIQKRPNDRYLLTCYGYANAAKVYNLPYEENGRWQIDGDILAFDSQAGEPIPSVMKSKYGNRQLSYARAYSGIKYLARYMQDVHAIVLKNVDIQFSYAGMGVDQQMQTHSSKKRIEISLTQTPKII